MKHGWKKGERLRLPRVAHSAQPDYDERRTPETKGPRHQGTTVRNQALGELRRMIDRGRESRRPSFILARQKTGRMNVSPEGHRKISHDHRADMGRANALAGRLVMVRSGLRCFGRTTHLAYFGDRIGQEIANEKKHR
jgi:hypothetical protein